MTVEERIRRCLILEEIQNNREIAKELGLKDISRFKSRLQNNIGEGKGKGR